jgi:hypothetical protein
MKNFIQAFAIALVCCAPVYAEDVILETKVVCATIPGEVIEFGGFNKIGPSGEIIPRGDTSKKGTFALADHKECYLFMQQIKNQTAQEIRQAAYAIAKAIDPAIVEPKR